jgi:hypothetical protein
MSEHDHDFDELLRRLLREEADAVEPAGDGLERIQSRLTRPRPALVVWVMAVFSGAWRRAQGAALSASAWLRSRASAASVRFLSPHGGRPLRWRSPAVLTAAGVVAVAGSVLALTPLPQQAVSGTAALFRSFGGAHGSGAGQSGGQAEGGGVPPLPGATSGSPPGKQAHPHPSASPTASMTPSPTPEPGSSSPASSPSPTPAPSSTPCPSPSVSPSPDPDSTASPSPGVCPIPTPTPAPTTGPTTDPPSSPTPTPVP